MNDMPSVNSFISQPPQLNDYEIVCEQDHINVSRYYVDGKILVFHPKAAQALGLPTICPNFPYSILNRGYAHDNVEHFVEFYESICRGDKSGKNSTEIRLPNGETRLYNRQFTNHFDENGKPIYATISLTDITEQREQVLAAEKWKYISTSLKSGNIHYYDYDLTRDALEEVKGSAPIYPEQNERTFTGVAHYIADNIIHPDDREDYLRVYSVKHLLQCFADGITEIVVQHRRLGADEKYFLGQGTIQLHTDPFNDNVLAFVVIKNLDEAMAPIRQRLELEARDALNSSIPGGVLFGRAEPGCPILSINNGFLTYLDYDNADELQAATQGLAMNIVHPDDRERITRLAAEQLHATGQYDLENRILTKNGEVKWVVNRGRINVDAEGRKSIACIMSDVTEIVNLREELEAQAKVLQRKNRELQTLTENVPGGVTVMRADDRFTVIYANATFYEMFGYTQKQCQTELNNEWARVIYPDDLEETTRLIFDTLKQEEKRFEHEVRVVRRGGEIIWVTLCGCLIEQSGESLIHAVMLDITARKEYEKIQLAHEQALVRAAKAAEEATRMKSAFLANMSHEIRTPMNGVIGFSSLALDNDELPDDIREYLKKIRVSASGLLEIIDDILDISKIEAGRMELEQTDFSLDEVLRQCDSISAVKAGEKGISFAYHVDPDLPKYISGDPTRLRQSLLNLLSNAIKFTQQGGVELTIDGESRDDKAVRIRFVVRDTGIGLNEEQIKRIFVPFVQADNTTTRNYGGTGLGLSITRNIVEMMGGRLEVESNENEGSVFQFSLPFEIANESKFISNRSSTMPSEKPIFEGTVLVCEDNAINQDVVRGHLEKVGLKSVIAENGRIGVDHVRYRHSEQKKQFDLVFMDLHMPVMDGIEATRAIRRISSDIPIVALTANAMPKDREAFFQAGMNDCLTKPFKTVDLWNCLMKYLTPVEMVAVSSRNNFSATDNSDMAQTATETSAIDRQLGLERSGDDDILYDRICVNFLRSNRDLYHKIEKLIRDGNRKEAHRLTHGLKSNAGMLGASRLQETARQLESALDEKQNGCKAELEPLMMEFQTAMNAVLSELHASELPLSGSKNSEAEIKCDENNKSGGEEQSLSISLDKERPRQLLDRIAPLIREGNTEVVGLLNEIKSVLGNSDDVSLLVQQIEDYDFDVAQETLDRIQRSFDVG